MTEENINKLVHNVFTGESVIAPFRGHLVLKLPPNLESVFLPASPLFRVIKVKSLYNTEGVFLESGTAGIKFAWSRDLKRTKPAKFLILIEGKEDGWGL